MAMHIGHVGLRVVDFDRCIDHAVDTLGLKVTLQGQDLALLTANDKHHELQLIRSDRSGLDHVGLEVETEAELDAIRDRMIAAGAEILSQRPEEPGLSAAIRCVGPAGIVFEVYTGMERSQLSLDNVIRPLARKLGHLTFFSDERDAVEHFVIDVLGFRISDRLHGGAGEMTVWMRCDSDHHGLTVGSSPGGTRLHHYAFELEGWSSVESYADNIARLGHQLTWGPGRHGPGFNIFTYQLDPAGTLIEAYTDLIRITDEAAYRPIDWSTESRSLNLWGPTIPDGFHDLGIPILGPDVTALQGSK